MRVGRRSATLVAGALLIQGMIALPAAGQDAGPGERVRELASGLNSPRGVDVDTAGNVYVAESGTGGDQCVLEEEEDEEGNVVEFETCFGTTGNVTRVAPDGTVDREFVTGLPSLAFEGEAVGPSDVSVAPDGVVYVTVGLGDAAQTRDEGVAEWGEEAAKFGTLLRVEDDGTTTVVADIAQWEAENNPDEASDLGEGLFDSNADGVHATDTTVYVADAGGNTILAVDPETGAIELEAVVESRIVELPPFLGGPAEIPMQSVPTAVTESPDGEIVFSELTGFPFPIGAANVYNVTDDPQDPEVRASGFTNLMGVTFRDGELFALELAHQGLIATEDMAGALVRVRENGSRVSLLRDVLRAPGGVASDDDGIIYLSNGSVFPEGGSLLAFDPSQAADPAAALACPADEVPGQELSDIGGNVHEEAIQCLAWYEVFTGFADGTFAPNAPITRAQFASTIARLIRASGTDLPAGDEGTFEDVSGTHADAINALAEAGVLSGYGDGEFRPRRSISRAQAVTIAVQAYEFVTGEVPTLDGDLFSDDEDSVHEESINRAAAAGWANGVAPGMFAPQREISRGQTASVLARVANTLVDEGEFSLPS